MNIFITIIEVVIYGYVLPRTMVHFLRRNDEKIRERFDKALDRMKLMSDERTRYVDETNELLARLDNACVGLGNENEQLR